MKQVGSFCFFILSCLLPIVGNSQCRSIPDLLGVLDGDKNLGEYAVDYDYINSIKIKGFDFPTQGQAYYFSNNDKLYLSKNKYCILTTSSACYRSIKSEVAKEQGAKVGSKSMFTFGDYNVEQYKHLNRDLIFEFHNNSSLGTFSIVLMTSGTATMIDNFIIEAEKRKKNEHLINEKLTEIRFALTAGNVTMAETLLNSAKKISKDHNLDELFTSDFNSLEKQIASKKFNDFKVKYDGYIISLEFIKARDLLNQYKTSPNNTSANDVKQLQLDLTKTAVDYFDTKIEQHRLAGNYSVAILYSDSLLIFDPNNERIKASKLEMISINAYLFERKTNVYDYWEINQETRNNIIRDFRALSLASINKGSGSLAFDIFIITDTTCNLKYNLNWKTSRSSLITFSETEKNKYKLIPYQKYGFCGNSEGKISFSLSWTSTKKSVKFVDKSFRDATTNNTVKNFISKSYPQTNGRFKYTEFDVNLNGEKINFIKLTGFHTRGPQNAIFSLLLPGTGSLFVSYGKKGFVPMALFGLGIATVLFTDDSLMYAAGITSMATAYLWDFTATIVIGSKNIARSKTVRKALRSGTILM
jgi:hypothetical protein